MTAGTKTASGIDAAHALLDAARDGLPVATSEIRDALRVTGDMRSDRIPIHLRRPVGSWEHKLRVGAAPAGVVPLRRLAGPFDGLVP